MEILIPSMGGHHLGRLLEEWASFGPGCVVEVGAWLGAGTVFLSRGAHSADRPLHVFDRWKASAGEVQKARQSGVHLQLGQDLLPLLTENLGALASHAHFHQGEIIGLRNFDSPIGLYVDDASKTKRIFEKSLTVFAPSWLDGCKVVLMDFDYYKTKGKEYRYQERVINRFKRNFRELEIERAGAHHVRVFIFKRSRLFTCWIRVLSVKVAIRNSISACSSWFRS